MSKPKTYELTLTIKGQDGSLVTINGRTEVLENLSVRIGRDERSVALFFDTDDEGARTISALHLGASKPTTRDIRPQ